MKWMKGMFLLLVANILIMVTLSLTVPILINVILPMFGIDLQGLVYLSSLVWALAFGFGGGPYYDYAYNSCWTQVRTYYGWQWVNVCGDYGY